MASSTENVKLGVCTVLFDGIDLGFTKGGVELEVSTSTHEVTVDQFGDTPIGELITGRMVKATAPLAETTLDNLVAIMPGATLVSDGTAATGTVTFTTTGPANGDTITIGDVTFVYKTTPVGIYELGVPANITAGATALAAAINNAPTGYKATSAAGVVNVTSRTRGPAGAAFTKTGGANVTVAGPTGGTAVTKAKVVVSTGVNINLLSVAKKLVLRPRGTNGEDDVTIYKAATPGALNFAYMIDNERVFSTEFKGYVNANGDLFEIGHPNA